MWDSMMFQNPQNYTTHLPWPSSKCVHIWLYLQSFSELCFAVKHAWAYENYIKFYDQGLSLLNQNKSVYNPNHNRNVDGGTDEDVFRGCLPANWLTMIYAINALPFSARFRTVLTVNFLLSSSSVSSNWTAIYIIKMQRDFISIIGETIVEKILKCLKRNSNSFQYSIFKCQDSNSTFVNCLHNFHLF